MKKITLLSLISILALMLFLIACSPNKPEEKARLFVQSIFLTFTKNVTTKNLIISNTGEGELSWQITDKPDWIEVSKSNGKVTTGKDTVIVTADVNQELGTYTGTISIKSNGGNKLITASLNITIWSKRKAFNTARYNAAACMLDGKIYLFGGTIGSGTGADATSVVEVYDPVSDTWTHITNMPKRITHPSACTLNGKIYIFGGAPRA